jgi:hypothetical protein
MTRILTIFFLVIILTFTTPVQSSLHFSTTLQNLHSSNKKQSFQIQEKGIFNILSLSGGSSPPNNKSNHSSILPHESSSANSSSKPSFRMSLRRNLLGIWGVLQVVSILANAIKRLLPIALQPIQRNDLSLQHWLLFALWTVYMAYAEGYKAFQLKFAPTVVSRAFGLADHASIVNYLLAGPYAMALFAAERQRMIVSWLITIGVFSLVKIVKLLPYPYRSIVDAGVVVGLSYGTISIILQTLSRLLRGHGNNNNNSNNSNNNDQNMSNTASQTNSPQSNIETKKKE